MSLALYRKYRPKTFKEVVGQEAIKQTLENEIKAEKISHAYLFFGPRGIGKTTMARLLAKAVNCEKRKKGESEPCNQCDSCLEINQGKSLDLIEIDAASNRRIDEIRELRERVRFRPTKSKYKVFIIDEVHMLTTEAFNALLKTLEEPPEYVIFILATTEIHKVPETIISRCQTFSFKPVSPEKIVKRLEMIAKKEEIKVEKEVLENIAYYSEGHPRDAESLLAQVFALASEEKKITLEQLKLILPPSNFDLVLKLIKLIQERKVKEALILINQLVDEGMDLEHFTNDLVEGLRKVLLAKMNLTKLSLPSEKSLEKEIVSLAKELKIKEILKMIQLFTEAKRRLVYSLPQLALETAVLEICLGEGENFIGENKVEENKEQENKENNLKEEKKKEESVLEDCPDDNHSKNQKESDLKISLEDIRSKWDIVLERLREDYYSLSAFLKLSKLSSFKDNLLTISLPYKFYLEKIKEKKTKEIIEKILYEVLGGKIKIKAVLEEVKEEEKKEEDSEVFKRVLKFFGGKIVD